MSKFKLDDGKYVEIEDKGNIKVKQETKIIHDIFYMLKLDEKLLSTRQFLKHNYSIRFDNTMQKKNYSKRKIVIAVRMTYKEKMTN